MGGIDLASLQRHLDEVMDATADVRDGETAQYIPALLAPRKLGCVPRYRPKRLATSEPPPRTPTKCSVFGSQPLQMPTVARSNRDPSGNGRPLA